MCDDNSPPPVKKIKRSKSDETKQSKCPMAANVEAKEEASENGAESNEKYTDNMVSVDELEKLREFLVLDEVKPNEGDSDANSDSSEGIVPIYSCTYTFY